MSDDPDAPNQRSLDERKIALFQVLATAGPLATETVHDGFMLLVRTWDAEALATLLTRYLSQPLSDSETAWAYMNLANALAIIGRPADAVLAHEAFERWLPGRTPRLSFEWPSFPSPENSPDSSCGPDEIAVEFLSQSVEFATAYDAVGRYNDYVSKVDAALMRLSPTSDNVELRFYAVRIFLNASEAAGDFERGERYISVMHALADEALDTAKVAQLHATTLMSEIQLARGQEDVGSVAQKIEQAMSLLAELDTKDSEGGDWVRGYRHHLALHLIQANLHQLALPLLDTIASTGRHFGVGFGWLMHAAAVWQVTHDRPRTLGLLRDARANDGRDLVGEFRALAGFGDVKDDPEFLQAIGG